MTEIDCSTVIVTGRYIGVDRTLVRGIRTDLTVDCPGTSVPDKPSEGLAFDKYKKVQWTQFPTQFRAINGRKKDNAQGLLKSDGANFQIEKYKILLININTTGREVTE